MGIDVPCAETDILSVDLKVFAVGFELPKMAVLIPTSVMIGPVLGASIHRCASLRPGSVPE